MTHMFSQQGEVVEFERPVDAKGALYNRTDAFFITDSTVHVSRYLLMLCVQEGRVELSTLPPSFLSAAF